LAVNGLSRAFARRYLTIDGRSLALCRIVLAGVLMVDLLRRVPWLRDLYTNEGLLPNHTELWRPWQPHLFSFFFMASEPEEAAVLFAISLFCFVCFAVGWHTRLFHLLSLAMTTSLHERNLIAENGGTVALATVMIWTAFLPLGRRFSVDALLASLRAHGQEQPDNLGPETLSPPDRRPAISLAALAVLLQIALIYWFNFVHKSGATWRTGTAIHYVLHQERIVTSLGLWARTHLPFVATKGLTYATLGIEAAAPALVLSPLLWRQMRVVAVFLLSGLHIGIALLVNVGIFSAAMMAFYPLLIDGSVWDWLARAVPMRGRRRRVLYDAGCGVCFQVVRGLARMDVFRRLTWIRNDDPSALPSGVDSALVERTIVVVDDDTGRRWTRADAFAQILGALPLGRSWAWVLRVPGLNATAGAAYDAFARNRTVISTWLGLAACSVAPKAFDSAPRAPEETTGPTLLQSWIRAQVPRLREAAVAVTLVVLAADASLANAAMPQSLRWTHRPAWMAAAVQYAHVGEGWSMFSPEAPVYDMMIVVDAITRDGRHVDPYNEVGSRVHALPVADIPARLDNDSMFCDYTLHIPGTGTYHQALLEWIQRYPERTGNPSDAIVSFQAFKLEHTPPAPGSEEATNIRRSVFLKWP
jgi:predicted DCC family thiol-disulfide oxidoreductase YuxK